jgi:hypothetical protein
LRQKALYTGRRIGIEDNKASNGWIKSFKNQQYCVPSCTGQCKMMDSSTVEEWRMELLFKIIEGYNHNIYNASEAGLFSRLPPDKTWSLKGDPCTGGKNSEIIFFSMQSL